MRGPVTAVKAFALTLVPALLLFCTPAGAHLRFDYDLASTMRFDNR